MTISAARVIAVGLLLLAAVLLAVFLGPAAAQTPPNEEVGLVRLSIGGEGCEPYETPERTAESPPQLVFSGLERCIRAGSSDEFTVAAPHIVWQSDFEIQLTIESAETGTIGFDAECSEVSAAYSLAGTRRVTPSGDEISPLAVTIYGCGGVGIGTVSAVLKDGGAAILYSEGYPVYFLDEPAVTGESSYIPPTPTVRLSLSPAALRPGGHAKLTYNVSGLTSTYSGLFSISSANRSVVGFSIGCTVGNTLSPRWSGRSSYSGTIAVYGCARGTVSLNWSVHQYIQGASKPGVVWAQDEPLSVTVSGPIVPLAPAPGNLRAASTSRTSVTLSWNSVDGVSFYRVRYSIRRGVTAEKYTSSTSYLATGLSCGTSYAFTVAGHGRAYGNYQFNWGYARQVTGRTSSCGTSPPPRPAPTPVPTPTPTPRPNPTITISAGQSKVVEGDTLSFTLTASSAPTSKLTVNLSVTGGEAFFSGTRSLSVDIAANTISVDLSLATTDDAVDEPDGIIKATINSGSGYIVGRNSSDMVDVADNDPPEISIARATNQAAEVQEGATLQFTLSATSAPTEAGGLIVTVNIQNGDAYLTNPTVTSLVTIKQGQTTATLRLGTEDDDVVEDNERIIVTIVAVGTTEYTADSEKYSAVVTVTSEDLPPPIAPTMDGEPETTLDSITLKWKALSGFAKYRVIYGLATQKAGHGGTTVETANNSLEITGLACSSSYSFEVSAYGDDDKYRAAWGAARVIRASTELCKLAAPTNLDVTPLPLRKAELSWDAVPNAVRYEISGRPIDDDRSTGLDEAKWSTPGASGCCSWHDSPTANGVVTDTKITIVLDNILVAQDAYQFRVTAVPADGSTTYQPSDGAKVIIIDTPIYRADGNSKHVSGDKGQAAVSWTPVAGLVEGVAPDGTYTVRYRKLGEWDGKDHSEVGWHPNNYGDWEPLISGLSSPLTTIANLELEEIYAIQVIYEPPASSGASPHGKVYSGRDAYVWPAKNPPDGRVATFQSFGHWPNRQLSYTVCLDTFPDDTDTRHNESEDWADMIRNAFGQWQDAVRDWVEITGYQRNCDLGFGLGKVNVLLMNDSNDIYMADPTSTDNLAKYGWSMAVNVYFICVTLADACVISLEYEKPGRDAFGNYGGVDMLLDLDAFVSRQRIVDSKPVVDYPYPHEVTFNTCLTPAEESEKKDFSNFELILHEAGHMLGLSGVSFFEIVRYREGYTMAHPTIADVVLNYDEEIPQNLTGDGKVRDEPDCEPHPFDILAVWALYQTVGR